MAFIVKRNVFGCKISILFVYGVSDDFTGKSLRDLLVIINIPIDDQGAVSRDQLGKLAERVADVRQIFEKVHMVFFYI